MLAGCVIALAVALSIVTGIHPLGAFYLTLLDLFAIDDPALGQPLGRQILQLLSGLSGCCCSPCYWRRYWRGWAPSVRSPRCGSRRAGSAGMSCCWGWGRSVRGC